MGKIIGITGGIASGKSTVTNFLRKQGLQVVDADAVVHQLQKPDGRLFQALVQHFWARNHPCKRRTQSPSSS